jgi:hypothetical protein
MVASASEMLQSSSLRPPFIQTHGSNRSRIVHPVKCTVHAQFCAVHTAQNRGAAARAAGGSQLMCAYAYGLYVTQIPQHMSNPTLAICGCRLTQGLQELHHRAQRAALGEDVTPYQLAALVSQARPPSTSTLERPSHAVPATRAAACGAAEQPAAAADVSHRGAAARQPRQQQALQKDIVEAARALAQSREAHEALRR